MKILKYILLAVLILPFAYSCMSDSENRLVRFSKSDLSDLAIYYGSKEGVKTVNIGGDSIQNMDSLKLAIMNRYFRSQFNADKDRFEGGAISYEFSDNHVTYINTKDTIGQLVTEYEFRNDSLFIDINDNGSKKQFFAGLGTSPSDIHYHSGFAYYYFYEDSIILAPKKDTVKVLRDSTIFTKDKLLTNSLIAEKFGFAEDLSDMAAKDTIVWCNVIYRFSK
ncbi:hypothetical protein [Dysgonomonas massiliensis]|uniref:hypothetical protein n=1 Tax=Dysgonomonas massiliensis TaxID=2040292 RepID=UPI0011AEC8AF|nr:hypothetical protein [Dysgonomonas massiliensis]